MRPLDFLGRIKVKLGIVIVLAVGTAFLVNELGIGAGWSRPVRIAVAVVLALVMVQLLAMGMTKPLREMARAAQTIAKGRYTLRVRTTSRDEVGELARAFNAMAADLGEVDRQRRELVANVSHELRTPITALRAVLENVVDGVSDADPTTMATALAQTERLGRLVAQLLDLSRLDSGVRLIEPEAVELAPLLEQAVREAELAREDVRLAPSVPADLVVRADPDLLAQVLANLLDNAVRHSPAGGVVRVTAEPESAGVRIVIADQGPGIPASARARVFERFSRLDTGRAADSGGAGLGLAIVKEIVELHGGSIRIDDCAGCRMIVDLPGRTTMAETPQETGTGEQPVVAVPELAAPAGLAPALTEGAVPGGVLSTEAASGAALAGDAVSGEALFGDAPAGVSAGVVSAASAVAGAVDTGEAVHVGDAEPGIAAVTGGVPEGAAPVPRPAVVGGVGFGRLFGGAVLGALGGFLVGLFGAVVVSVFFSGAAALATLMLAVLAGVVLGVAVAGGGRPRPRPASGSAYPPPVGTAPVGTAQVGTAPVGTAQVGAVPPAGPYSGGQRPPYGGQQGGPYGMQQGGPPGYVPPPLFPKPDLPETPRWLLPAAAGAGVFAAVALPDAQAGLGVVLVAVVLGAAALPAVLRRMTPWTLAYGMIAYWLIAMAAVRDADWLVAVLLLAGAGLGALAVSGAGAGWLGVIRGGVSVLLALGPVAWFLGGPLRRLVARRHILPTLSALAITVVLLLVFGLLFASADAVFAAYVQRLTTTPVWMESAPARVFLFVVFAVLLAAVVLVALRPVNDPMGPAVKLGVARSVWLVPLTAVNLLFAAFVTVQVTALFGGDAWVRRTAGLTYAEYARQGFFQLVVVSVFVLGIVAVAGGMIRTARRERWVMAGELGVLCALTMVVLASALHRMDLYTDAYGLSRLRLSVQATVWWLGAVFVLVLLAGAVRLAGNGAGWLPRTVVLVTGLGVVAFALINPDLRVAQSAVEVRGVERIDADYLGDLGAEAVPALDRLPEPKRSCVLASVVRTNGLSRPDPWNGWNLARSQARDVLAAHPVGSTSSCPTTGRYGTE
ncbi:DUF4153 domain-containing protein [Nonomuraea sediminis]|uniref:DUF4153 domain-containing protein n=1 Tax=Nonomuraea sediminis TaxID=2835864 RepID=UPI001BDCF0DA|nr:DUF4153 domain-containing protein [Nonomuraea sediminis]